MRFVDVSNDGGASYIPTAWDIDVSVSRLAISLLGNVSKSMEHKLNVRNNSITQFNDYKNTQTSSSRSFIFVLYGIQGQLEVANDDDKIINLRIGSCRAFGGSGFEILSCGSDPDVWLHEMDMGKRCSSELALSLKLQWCATAQNEFSSMEFVNVGQSLFEEKKDAIPGLTYFILLY